MCVLLLVIEQSLPTCNPQCPVGFECNFINGTYSCGGQSFFTACCCLCLTF